MRAAKVILLGLTLAALMVPLVYAITFIGAINYVGPHGGNTTFSQNFTAYSLTYGTGLNQFTSMVWGGNLRGNFGVDADAGVNVTVTAIGRDQVTYTVTTLAPGNVDTYIYYYRNISGGAKLRAPTEVTANGAAAPFTYAGGVASITTTGSPVTVVATYGVGDVGAGDTLDILLQLLPLVALIVALEARRLDLIGNRIMVMVMLVAAVGFMVWLFHAYGY
jgi:hypothetical protein